MENVQNKFLDRNSVFESGIILNYLQKKGRITMKRPQKIVFVMLYHQAAIFLTLEDNRAIFLDMVFL